VYLHYSGGAGDLSKLGLYYLGYDTNDGIDDDRAKNFQMNNPSFVIVPQTTTEFDISKIISLVEEYKTKYRIDQTRIYIIGYSLGGPASYSLANAYFDYNKQLFAGIIRLSGQSETTVRNEIANKTAIWLQVGLNDLALRVSITKDAYNFLKNYHSTAVESSQAVSVGGKSGITYTLTKNNKEIVKKTEYTDVGHDIMTFPFADGNLINWLFKQKVE
jgi:predicted peptidase